MRAGVGYSEQPDTAEAGRLAVEKAMRQAGRSGPCDLVLLFATAQHDARILRDAVACAVGSSVPIIGGGTVGAICNDHFGYAGNQIILACLWLDGVRCDLLAEGDLRQGEAEVGRRLGKRLLDAGVTPDSPLLLFYDSINDGDGGIRMHMATYLLAGMEDAMGFLPRTAAGAGMMGDYACSPVYQWTGVDMVRHNAMALLFSDDVRVDTTIMHGCRPGSGYHTVTRAEGQMILEINGQPALRFMNEAIGSNIPPENFPFFLTLGRNTGDKWGEFDEEAYVNRLCLAVEAEREALVMFEPDMVEGTEFQIMYRSLDLDYMAPSLDACFSRLEGRKPVFAMYINCAGRAAGYNGSDLEDAAEIQKIVADRVPLLGIYTGVEIAPVRGRPRGLDWTGVFCLFSVPE
ncbi:MAG: FIST C-terminal domain-containing protein [Desulfovibrio sp.]|jgi:hypothetical protein|nr:FIST C-terminal domain-containing protein [Desulfovibrio sp.]